jgi:hypothetical protein
MAKGEGKRKDGNKGRANGERRKAKGKERKETREGLKAKG